MNFGLPTSYGTTGGARGAKREKRNSAKSKGLGPMGRKLRKVLQKSLDVLVDKSEDCADLAKTQRADADKAQVSVDRQHESAHKLEKLSIALAQDAAEIKGELVLDELANPPRRDQPASDTPQR